MSFCPTECQYSILPGSFWNKLGSSFCALGGHVLRPNASEFQDWAEHLGIANQDFLLCSEGLQPVPHEFPVFHSTGISTTLCQAVKPNLNIQVPLLKVWSSANHISRTTSSAARTPRWR